MYSIAIMSPNKGGSTIPMEKLCPDLIDVLGDFCDLVTLYRFASTKVAYRHLISNRERIGKHLQLVGRALQGPLGGYGCIGRKVVYIPWWHDVHACLYAGLDGSFQKLYIMATNGCCDMCTVGGICPWPAKGTEPCLVINTTEDDDSDSLVIYCEYMTQSRKRTYDVEGGVPRVVDKVRRTEVLDMLGMVIATQTSLAFE